jgi:hypothetical protein
MKYNVHANEQRMDSLKALGGRLIKWKGVVASIAPACSAIAIFAGMSGTAYAQNFEAGGGLVGGSNDSQAIGGNSVVSGDLSTLCQATIPLV